MFDCNYNIFYFWWFISILSNKINGIFYLWWCTLKSLSLLLASSNYSFGMRYTIQIAISNSRVIVNVYACVHLCVCFFPFEMTSLIRIAQHRWQNNQKDENKHLFVSASNKNCAHSTSDLDCQTQISKYIRMSRHKKAKQKKTNCNTFNDLISMYLICNFAVYFFFLFLSLGINAKIYIYRSDFFYRLLIVEFWQC